MPRRTSQKKKEESSIPKVAEDILVLTELPTGRKEWWPATVEEVTESNDHCLLADATVLYHAAFSYKAERGTVQFHENGTVRTKIECWTEGAWRYPEDDVDPGASITNERRAPSDTRQNDTPEKEKAISDRAPKDQRKQKRHKISPTHNASAPQPELYQMVQEIQARVADNERQMMVLTGERKNHEIGKRVTALRAVLTDTILRNAQSTPRPGVARNNSTFAHVLAVGSTEHRFQIDYDLFMYMLKDIENAMLPYGSVIFKPSGEDLPGRAARMKRHVIFRNVRSWFSWLGITEDMNRAAILIEDKNQTRAGGVQSLRIMGAMRQNYDDEHACMQLHVGRSASNVKTARFADADPAVQAMYSDPTTSDGEVDCIAYASSCWNEENSVFAFNPSVRKGHTGPLSEDGLDSTFSISWEAKPPLSKGAYAVTPHFAEGVQLGYVVVRYPYVLVRGRSSCDAMREALYNFPLHEVL